MDNQSWLIAKTVKKIIYHYLQLMSRFIILTLNRMPLLFDFILLVSDYILTKLGRIKKTLRSGSNSHYFYYDIVLEAQTQVLIGL